MNLVNFHIRIDLRLSTRKWSVEDGAPFQREIVTRVWHAVRESLSPEMAYFACYGRINEFRYMEISAALKEPKDLQQLKPAARMRYLKIVKIDVKRRAVLALKQALSADAGWKDHYRRIKIAVRGELSPLHSALVPLALMEQTKDSRVVADAIHWFLNAAGYNYVDEIMIAAHAIYGAALSIHHDPKIAPFQK